MELHIQLYTSTPTFRAIKSRRVQWVGHAALMGAIRNARNILVGNLKERYHLSDRSLDEKIAQNCILDKKGLDSGSGFKWLVIRSNGGIL
jgi:hypothetical protein